MRLRVRQCPGATRASSRPMRIPWGKKIKKGESREGVSSLYNERIAT